jgi:hypothetical protein
MRHDGSNEEAEPAIRALLKPGSGPVLDISTPKRLYDLIPAIYRTLDAEGERPLEALATVAQSLFDALDTNVGALYANWFIETCDDWAVPYIADLIGVSGLQSALANLPTQRARVADTLLYRSRAGTAGALARACGNASGWPAVVLEDFQRTVVSANLRISTQLVPQTAAIRDTAAMAVLSTPFSRTPATVTVTSPPAATEAENTPKVTLSALPPHSGTLSIAFWRLAAFALERVEAKPLGEGLFSLHPMGVTMPLVQYPKAPQDHTQQLKASQVPSHVTPDALRRCLAAGGGGADLPFAVYDHAGMPIRNFQVAALDGRMTVGPREALIDPRLGRVALGSDLLGGQHTVWTDHCWGAAGKIGGGPYHRDMAGAIAPEGPAPIIVAKAPWLQNAFIVDDQSAASNALPKAYPPAELADRLNTVDANGTTILLICDNGRYRLPDGLKLNIGGGHLCIVALPGTRPCIEGDLHLSGAAASVRLDGLLWEGSITLSGTVDLHVADCTIGRPLAGRNGFQPAILASPPAASRMPQHIDIRNSIVGPLRLPAGPVITIADSIVDAGDGVAIGGREDRHPGPLLELRRATVFGDVTATPAEWSDTIITGRLDHGHGPIQSAPPRCFLGRPADLPIIPLEWWARRYGMAGYGLPSTHNPPLVAAGGTCGQSLGAFHNTLDRQRELNLSPVLDELAVPGMGIRTAFVD